MKILIAADIFPPESGGPATYSVTLANELVKQGVEVKIVSLNPDGDTRITQNTYHVTQRNKALRYVNYLWLLFKHAKDVDVVYAMGPVNAGLPALLVARIRRKKFVVKVVGDYAWEQGIQRFGVTELMDEFQQKQYGGAIRLLRSIESFVTGAADQVITPCAYLKRIVEGWGVPASKIEVIYNAVSVQTAVPIEKSQGERWIVSNARLTKWKGMDTLITMMKTITAEFSDVRLKIIGGGPEYEHLKRQVDQEQIGHVVELTGNLPRKDALRYVAAADLFILNSGYEGLSHALIEALHAGRPVAASNAGGDSEVVIPGKTGMLFSYNNLEEITTLVRAFLRTGNAQNQGLQTPWRQEFFAQFAIPTMVEKTKLKLEDVCAN